MGENTIRIIYLRKEIYIHGNKYMARAYINGCDTIMIGTMKTTEDNTEK